MILEVKNLEIGYQHALIRNISFSCVAGQLTCLLGRNGAGKSTLIRSLAGLEKIIAGEVHIAQKNLKTYSPKQLAQKIAIVLSDRIEVEYLSVYEAVSFGRSPYLNWLGKYSYKDTFHIEEALKVTETDVFRNKYLDKLSDGQRQRVMLAIALAQDTPIVLLDEPTAYLDIYYRKKMMLLFKKIAVEQNKCLLLSTHEIDLAKEHAQQLLLMNLEGNFRWMNKKNYSESEINSFLGM